MLAVQERGHDDVEAHGLALLGGAGDQQVRRVGEVEHADLLGDRVADGDRQVGFAAAEGLVVEQGLQRHDGGVVVGHLDADGVGQGHDAHALGVQRQGDVLLEFLDIGNLHARSGEDLV